mgnify:CR=1 FL=1
MRAGIGSRYGVLKQLDRCRTQFKLVADIEKKLDKMSEITANFI